MAVQPDRTEYAGINANSHEMYCGHWSLANKCRVDDKNMLNGYKQQILFLFIYLASAILSLDTLNILYMVYIELNYIILKGFNTSLNY